VSEWTLGVEYRSSYGIVRYGVFGQSSPIILVHGTAFSSYYRGTNVFFPHDVRDFTAHPTE
jgi:hypothetical protein